MDKTNPVTQAIAENARRLIASQGQKIAQRLAPLLSAAEDGVGMAAEILKRTVLGRGHINFELLRQMIEGESRASAPSVPDVEPARQAPPPNAPSGPVRYERDAPSDDSDIVLPAYMTEHEALKRVRRPDLDITGRTPVEILEETFEGMEYARAQRSEKEPFAIGELASRELAERAGRLVLEGLREARRNGIRVPPPPSSEKYDELLENIVGMKPQVLEAWKSWEYWRIALACQFAGLLVGRRNTRPPAGWSAKLERVIEGRRAWYQSLSSFGVEDADIEKAIKRIHGRGGFDDLRALAELRRFAKPDDEGLMRNPHSALLLASAVIMLHAEAPEMDEDDFLRLLPHYAYPMTAEGALRMLREQNPVADRFMLQRARAMLTWHMHPSDEQVESISAFVRKGGAHFRELDAFTRDMLGVKVEDLLVRIGELASQGLAVEHLARDLMDAFPGQVKLDLEKLRKTSKAQPAEEDEDVEERSYGGTMMPVPEDGGGMKADAAEAESRSAEAAAGHTVNGGEQMALALPMTVTSIKPVK